MTDDGLNAAYTKWRRQLEPVLNELGLSTYLSKLNDIGFSVNTSMNYTYASLVALTGMKAGDAGLLLGYSKALMAGMGPQGPLSTTGNDVAVTGIEAARDVLQTYMKTRITRDGITGMVSILKSLFDGVSTDGGSIRFSADVQGGPVKAVFTCETSAHPRTSGALTALPASPSPS